MKAYRTRLGLGKLKALHSLSYFLGIGFPAILILWAWVTSNSLNDMDRVLFFAFAMVLVGFLFEHYYAEFRYMDCPFCGDNILVRFDWECGGCGSCQGEERLLIEPCRHCGEKPEKISCMGCKEEMSL